MGQRFQTLFILPGIHMNEDNPNNREEKVLIFHNQWLYGRGALNVNLSIIERLQKAMKKYKECGSFSQTKQDFINHHLERTVENAVSWGALQELHNESNFSRIDDHKNQFVYGVTEKCSLVRALNSCDNNNGFFICSVDKDLKIKFAFISGLEDTDENEYKTPQDYLKLFYTDEQLKKDKCCEGMQEIIKKFNDYQMISESDMSPII